MTKDRALIRWFALLVVVGMTALTTASRAQETPPDDYLQHRLPQDHDAVFKAHVPRARARRAATEFFEGREAVTREVLVKFRPTTSQWVLEVQAAEEVDDSEWLGGTGVLRLHSGSKDVATLVRELSTRPDVEYAEPNYIVHTIAIPNDPRFGELWGLQNTGQPILRVAGTPGADISAVPAWDISTGSKANVVAVLDTGIDYTHPDLAANVWSAPAGFTVTIGGRAITCPAGSHGFNAITNVCDPLDDNSHGSHVSGTIGAVGNNGVGVVGVNWTASIMGSKFLDATGAGTTANAINAIEFVVQAKLSGGANVRVLSNSWGGGFSQALLDEINRANANDMLFVAAAGNSRSDNDVSPQYPASYDAPNVVAVAATDNADVLASFSNFGPNSVHLGAPGVNVLSTVIGGSYDYFSGTSMATPHVSGAAILILSKCALNTADLKTNILNNVDPIPSLAGLTVSGGRLNVSKAIRACAAPANPDFALSAMPASQTVTPGGSTSYTLSISASGGFTGTVSFSGAGLPAGASASFRPNPATGSATMTVSTGAATPTGSFPVTITGTSGNLMGTTSVTLVVNAAPKPDFSVSPSSASRTVTPGGSTTYTANITRLGRFAAGVSFSVAGLPAGATARFNPNPAMANSSVLTVTTAAITPAGSFALTITGVGGGLTRTTSVRLVVTAPTAHDFSLAASPAFQNLPRGGTTSYTVNITRTGGFSAAVSLDVSGLPSGVKADFSPNPATADSSTLILTAAGNTSNGNFTLTITGLSRKLTRRTSVTLVATAPTPSPASGSLTITNPAASSTVRGTTTFSVQARNLPSLHSVEYLLNGKKLYSAGDPAKPVASPPYSYNWHTANVWDGRNTVMAVARDASGAILASSAPVPFTIANTTVTMRLISPDHSRVSSGTLNWTVATNLGPPIGKPVYLCFVDGQLHSPVFTSDQTFTMPLDTTGLANGPHELFCALYAEASPETLPYAMSQVIINVDNGRTARELRANYKEVFLARGENLTLSAKLIYTNGDEEAAPASYTSSDNSVATVSRGGLVTAIAPGIATITLTAGGRTATTRVTVNGFKGFPHFSKDGQILTAYDPARSIFLRTLFNLSAGELSQAPGLGLALQQSGVNAITSGFYFNPADNSANNDWNQWRSGMDNVLLNPLTQAAAQNGLSIFLTGDDLARTTGELNDSIANSSSVGKIQYALNWARNAGRVVAIDMIDESDYLWGDTPTPTDGRWLSRTPSIPDSAFKTLMGILNSVPGRPKISWPVSGGTGSSSVKNWQGNPDFADFGTIYWQSSGWRRAYPESDSLYQVLSDIDGNLSWRLPYVQRDRPVLLLTSLNGPMYMKLGPGSGYTTGQDKIQAQGLTPEQVAAQIMLAAAKGMAGVRVYAYDFSLWKSQRANAAPGAGELQTGADPFQTGVERWNAMSAAFNLIKNLEPYLLSPQTSAIDLGPTVFTGAKDGPNGRLLFAINSLEVSQTIRADLSPYLYANSSSIQRYRLGGANLASESLPRQTTDTLTLNPGEVAVWLIRPANP